MKLARTIKAGMPGSKKLFRKYGERLLCVRYRVDKEKMKRYKTIELIVDEWSYGEDVDCLEESEKFFYFEFGGGYDPLLYGRVRQAGAERLEGCSSWRILLDKAKELGLVEHPLIMPLRRRSSHRNR